MVMVPDRLRTSSAGEYTRQSRGDVTFYGGEVDRSNNDGTSKE